MKGNNKSQGEQAELIVAGELGKMGMNVLFPFSDNLRFDLVLYIENEFHKAQVKSTDPNKDEEYSIFHLKRKNWYNKESYYYTDKEIDVMFLCDFENTYVIGPEVFTDVGQFRIRLNEPDQNRTKRQNFAEDYLLSEGRLSKILN